MNPVWRRSDFLKKNSISRIGLVIWYLILSASFVSGHDRIETNLICHSSLNGHSHTEVCTDVCSREISFVVSFPAYLTTCITEGPPPNDASFDEYLPAKTKEQVLALAVWDSGLDIDALKIENEKVGPVREGNIFTFTRRYTFTLGSTSIGEPANDVITYKFDPTPPVLRGIPSHITLACGTELPDWPKVSAYDDGMTLEVGTAQRHEPETCEGRVYLRQWTASDACGNTVTKTQSIRFTDSDAPMLVIPADTSLQTNDEIPQPTYTASDRGCSQFTVDFAEEVMPFNNSSFLLLRTWTAIDGCDNITTKTQSIRVSSDVKDPITRIARSTNLLNEKLFPNPTQGNLDINFTLTREEKVEFDIMDNMGNKMVSSTANLPEGYNIYTLNTSGLAIGTYTLQIKVNDYIGSHKLIKSQ